MYAYSGILTALYRRETTGQVSAVEVALFEALAEWMGAPAYYTGYGGTQPPRVGAEHATIAPYGPFDTADGATVLLTIQNDREWASLCEIVLGDAALATDARFARGSSRVANRVVLNDLNARHLGQLDVDEAVALLDRANVANARLNSVAQFLDHPSLLGRERWRDVDSPGGSIRALMPPANLSDVPVRMDPIPAVGQHTEAILSELGFGPDDVSRMRKEHVV
jgi:formyl-CoA transferase